MDNYGFEYWAKRAETLTEMARTSPLTKLGEAGNTAKSLFDEVGKVIKQGGEVDGEFVPGMAGNRGQDRQLRFFLYIMFGMENEEYGVEVTDKESSAKITDRAAEFLGYSNQPWRIPKGPFRDQGELFRAAIIKGVQGAYKDKILSPEFKEKVLNKENILTFVKENRVGYTPTSLTQAEIRKERFGLSPEELDYVESGMDIKDIIIKIYKEQGYRNSKNKQLSRRGSLKPKETSDNFDENLFIVLDALDILISNTTKVKNFVNERMDMYENETDLSAKMKAIMELHDKYPAQTMENLIKLYHANTETLNNFLTYYGNLQGTGLDMGEFQKKMEFLKKKYPNNPTIELIQDEIRELQKLQGDIPEEHDDPDNPLAGLGIDRDILEKHLTSPELIEKFRKYATLKNTKRRFAQEDADKRVLSVDMRRHIDNWEYQKMMAENEALEREVGIKAQELEDTESDLEDMQQNESYVMDYMSDQINKDKFKPSGTFKDRGFKKANYVQWLWINQ